MRKVIDELIEHKKLFEELVEVQTNSNLELQGIAQDISDLSSKFDNFNKLTVSTNKSDELERKDESAKEEEKRKSSENKSIYELRKIREAVLDSARADVADQAQQDPAFHTFATRMDAVKEMFGDIKDSFRDRDTGKIGVGSTLKGMARGVATSFSANARNREEFIKTQKGLGSTRSDKVLKDQYKEQQALLYRNNKNERRMNDARGNLSKEEFLKGNSKKAQEYLKEKTNIGAGLSQVDERYKIKNPEKTDREKDADFFGVGKGSMKRPKPDESPVEPTSTESPVEPISVPTSESVADFSSIVDSLKEVISKLSDSIEPMTKSDVSTEDKLEAQRSTNEFQKNQLDLMVKQNKVLDDSLKVHNLILEELKKRTEEIVKKTEIPKESPLEEAGDVLKDAWKNRKTKNRRPRPTRNNSRRRRGLFGLGAAAAGVGAAEAMDVTDIIPDTPDITPNRTTTVPEDPKTGDIKPGDNKPKPTTLETPKKTGGGILDKAKGVFNKIPGSAMLKTAGKVALRAAVPIGIAATAYEVGSASIDAYDESFGEGGKKVLTDLVHKKAVDYNFFDSEVLDWKQIEELPTDDLKKLIHTGVKFKPEDESKLHEILNHKLITGDTKTTPEAISSSNGDTKTTPEAIGPMSEVKPEAVTPEKNQPGIAKAVYDKSAEVAPVAGGSSTVVNNISAPTNNVTAPNTSAPTKFEPRNNDSTVNRLFANRQFY